MNDWPRKRWLRPLIVAISGIVICTGIGLVAHSVVTRGSSRHEDVDLAGGDWASTTLDGKAEARIVAFCSDCHALPAADAFPRDRWHREVQRGYEFYARSGRNDLDPPPMEWTVAYYRARAPQRLVFPPTVEAAGELAATFSQEELPLDAGADARPEIAHLRWAKLDPDRSPLLLVCDMRFGYVAAADLGEPRPQPRVLARLGNPCHIEPCDLDEDGLTDLVVADLGSFRPADHDRGRVVWLRRQQSAGPMEEIVLVSGLGRVADAQPADFDADGDLDLIVAEFGHYRTGKILLLRNEAPDGESPRFEPETIDSRPGTIHVPVHDFNGDGYADFVALVSQEAEAVDLFINLTGLSHNRQGGVPRAEVTGSVRSSGDGPEDGRFQLHNLWAGPDLTFGSSGIQLVDLDQDGDMDVLYTNGDAWDNWYLEPSHGIQWLENRGGLTFAYHRLADMPGAYRALAGDIDLDGDLDILTVAWFPTPVKPPEVVAEPPVSILCLEQTEPGVFVRHTLETGSPYYATLEMADFDGDGDLDFAVGPGPLFANTLKQPHWLTVWRNQAANRQREE